MRRIIPVVLIASVSLLGCKAKEAYEQAKAAAELAKSGSTTKLLKETAEDKYDPPKDGKLTDAQVQMYLKVREHEKVIVQAAKEQLKEHDEAVKKAGEKSIAGAIEGFKGLGSVTDILTADIRAAKDLHYNTQEYLWVKGQVLTASTAALGEKMADAMSTQMDATYQQMKKAYDEAKDDQTKAMYKQTLDSLDQQKKESAAQKAKEDPSITYNRQLLAKYESELSAFASEMAKYEDKPGEAQKSIDQFQKDLEKAKANAGKQQQ
jgi:hypothetical protein